MNYNYNTIFLMEKKPNPTFYSPNKENKYIITYWFTFFFTVYFFRYLLFYIKL